MYILASGESMFPTLKNGEYYKLDVVQDNNFNVGDIIVYKMKGTVICHRIIDVYLTRSNRIFIKTKGDNCKCADRYAVTIDKIVGKINLYNND